jgi:hypothetical protein
MRRSMVPLGHAALVGLGIAFMSAGVANAESVMQRCGAEWQAAKAAGTTDGQTWQEFLKTCRAQHDAGAQAPAPSMRTVPAPPVTQTGEVPAPAAVPLPLGPKEFASEKQARARCPHDTIVWVNALTGVYHFPGVSAHGQSYYGNTSQGAYMCEADARAAGDRAAKDERHR